MYLKLLTILVTLIISVNSFAGPKESEAIKQALKNILPGMEINKIVESPFPGLYSVLIGAELLYVSGDGKYLFKGDLIDVPNKVNLSEQIRSVARKSILKSIPAQEYISFSPDKPNHQIYVFTDITCGFCQKLQSEISEINKVGIAVNYLAFPRAGVKSAASNKMEFVWCAKDRKTAFMNAMIGLDVDEVNCTNPVVEHYGLGQAMGVRGTPAIFTEDGRYLPGYMPPNDLLKAVTNN